jgi:signal transduction histidine kinase
MTAQVAYGGRSSSGWWVVPALVLVLAGTFASNHDVGATAVGGAVLAGLATVSLLLVPRRPAAAVLVSAALVAAYFGLGYADGPVFLLVPAAAFLVAVQQPPARWLPATAGAVAMVSAGLLVRGLWWEHELEKNLWQALAVVAVAAAAAAIATTVRSRRQTTAERAQRAAAEEQLRMAQDLHDGVGHGLAVIAMQSGVVLHLLDKPEVDRDAARRALHAIRDTSRESLDALRAELSRLAPGTSAPRAARRGLAELDVLLDRVRAGGLVVVLQGSPPALPGDVDEAAYVIVQESLTNVLRHASATRAVVELRTEGETLVVSVTDDGQGGEVVEGMGVSGMRARAQRLGGSLEVGRSADGFRVRAVLPLGGSA